MGPALLKRVRYIDFVDPRRGSTRSIGGLRSALEPRNAEELAFARALDSHANLVLLGTEPSVNQRLLEKGYESIRLDRARGVGALRRWGARPTHRRVGWWTEVIRSRREGQMTSLLIIIVVLLFITSAILGVPRLLSLFRALFRSLRIFGEPTRAKHLSSVESPAVLSRRPEVVDFDQDGIRLDTGARKMLLSGAAGPPAEFDLTSIRDIYSHTVNGADIVVIETTGPTSMTRTIPFFTAERANDFAAELKRAIANAGGPRLK